MFVDGITKYSLPATKGRIEEYKLAQEQDMVCEQVRSYCESEWPDKKFSSPMLVQVRSTILLCVMICCCTMRE